MPTRTVLVCVMLCIGTSAAQVTPSQPVVYYSFDTLGNVVADESGNKNNGTVMGGVTLDDAGYLGKCFAFNGRDSYVQLTRVIQDSFAITAWIKTGTTGLSGTQAYQGNGLFWSDVGGVANDFVVAVLGTKLSFFAGSPDLSVNSNGDIVTGDWVHIAAVRDTGAKTLSVYLNGDFDNSISHPNTGPLNAQPNLAIGANTLDARFYEGSIDEVRIYSRALTAKQIGDLYGGAFPTFVKAENPDPPDGTVGVVAPLLRWTKGDTTMFHNVYLGTSPDLTEADLRAVRQPVTLYYHLQGLLPGTTYYWRVDEIEKDGVTIHTGDVWSFVTQDVTAYYPNPTDGSNTVSPTPTLTWMPGMGAIKHQVYFSDSLDAVTQGAAEADKGTQELANTAFAPGVLEPLTTYYWRVDETIGGGAVKTGKVWSFTTVLPVDDFESYTDDEGSRIYETWIDGYTTGNSGSTVGYFSAPFTEQTIVHGGSQSMPLEYNNVDAPWYSEAERTFAAAQDWTAGGVDTLVLYVRGRPGNAATPLYVALQDAAQKVAAVTHPNPAVATATKWTEWKIPLADFAGVNPARIRTMYLGLGDRQNPQPGPTGRIYIDDICLARPAP